MISLILVEYYVGGKKMDYKKAKVNENSHVSGSSIDQLGVRVWDGARVENSDFDENVSIGNDSIIVKSKISKNCEIGRRNIISNSQIGTGTSTQSNTTIRFATVGKYCAIAWNVTIGAPNHDFKRLAMAELDRIFPGEDHEHLSSFDTLDCNIGNDVWIAAGAHVLRGVKVSDGAVIAANAVVTKDVPPYAIVAGVPAKIVKYRFSDEQIKSLLEIKWWDFTGEKLLKARHLFNGDLDDEIIEQLKHIKGEKTWN